jgi:hypothetical protein
VPVVTDLAGDERCERCSRDVAAAGTTYTSTSGRDRDWRNRNANRSKVVRGEKVRGELPRAEVVSSTGPRRRDKAPSREMIVSKEIVSQEKVLT